MRVKKAAAIILMIANIPMNVFAENDEELSVRMSGIYESLNYISAICEDSNAKIKWYLSDNVDSDGSLVESGEQLFISSDMKGKYVRAEATTSEESVSTPYRRISSNSLLKSNTDFYDARHITPEENKFYIDGKGYILLDTTESDLSHFFVMSEDIVGERIYSNDNNQLFTDMCAFLNNKNGADVYTYDEMEFEPTLDYSHSGYKGNLQYTQLPEQILSHIDNEHIWKNEPTNVGWYSKTEVGTVCGIAIPSAFEVKKYADKIGVGESFWLRTPRGISGTGRDVLFVSGNSRGEISVANTKTDVLGIRPVFFLDRNFFKDVAIPLGQMGSNVKKAIRKEYSEKELENKYTEAELKNEFEFLNDVNVDDISLLNAFKTEVLAVDNCSNISIELCAGDEDFLGTVNITASSGNISEGINVLAGEKKNIIIPITFVLSSKDRINVEINDIQENTVFSENIQPREICTEVVGKNETYGVLEIKCADDFDVEWMMADSENGTYKKIAYGRKLNVGPEYATKYIKAKVIAQDGTTQTTSAISILPATYTRQTEFIADTTLKTHSKIPEENVFSVGGKRFILLDTQDDEASKFFVISAESLKRTQFLGGSENEDAHTMIEYINGDFLDEGYIPQQIINHVNESVVWKCEPVKYPTNQNNERVFVAGFALPSVTEYKKYADKINVYDKMGWWTRTPEGSLHGPSGIIAPSGDVAQMGIFYTRTSEELGIRPVFYLDRNFFKEERIDIGTLGDNVRNVIFDNYEKSELSGIYSADEVEEIFDKGNVSFALDNIVDAENPIIPMSFRKKSSDEISYKIGYVTDKGETFETNVVFPQGMHEMNYVFSIESLSYGVHNITVYAETNGKRVNEKSAKMTFMPSYKKQFMDGICTYRGYCDASMIYDDAAEELYKMSGANAIRCGVVEWHKIEKQKGVYDFSELDVVVDKISELNSEPVLLLCYSNELYMPSENGSNKLGPATTEAVDAFAKMAAAVAARYPNVKNFEIYNEPNIFFWEPYPKYSDYAALLKVAGMEIKKVSPDSFVVGGVVAEAGEDFLEQIYRVNVYPYIDAISFHPYIFSNGGRTDEKYQNKLNSMLYPSRAYGGFKKQMVTEIGWPTCEPDIWYCDEETQAIEDTKLFVYHDVNQINYTTIYNLTNCGYNREDKEAEFGVIDYDGVPKMSYAANSNLFRMLGGAVYFGELDINDNVVAALYAKDNMPMVVMWNSSEGGNSESEISVNFPNELLTVYDMFGNKLAENVSAFSLDRKPVYVSGFSKDIFLRSLKETYEDSIDRILYNSGISQYSFLFNRMKARISALDTLSDKFEATDIMKTHFAISDIAINYKKNREIQCDTKTLASIINAVYESGRILESYLQVVSNDCFSYSTAEERIEDASEYIENKKSGIAGAKLPYAESVLKIAKLRLEESKKVEAETINNPQKNGVIKAWRQKAWLMAQTAIRIAEIEEVTADNIIVQCSSEDRKATINVGGIFDVAVYNYGETEINGVISIVNENGNVLGESNVSLLAGQSTKLSINLGATEENAYVRLIENGKIIKNEKCTVAR